MKCPTKKFQSSLVNVAIVSSMRMDKGTKSFLVRKYNHLVKYNGKKYAADVFKNIREHCMLWRSKKCRDVSKLQIPVYSKSVKKRLCMYLNCQPSMVLNFLKLYCTDDEPLVSVKQSADQQDSLLKSMDVNTDVPKIISAWIELINKRYQDLGAYYRSAQWFNDHVHHKLCAKLTFNQFVAYWRKWKKIFTVPKLATDEAQRRLKEPLPEMYHDFSPNNDVIVEGHKYRLDAIPYSLNYSKDVWNYATLQDTCEVGGWIENPSLTPASISYINGLLAPEVSFSFEGMHTGEWKPEVKYDAILLECVGEIQHIPKTGTVKRRAIAVPNRFVQLGLCGIHQLLEKVVKRLPCDATYDQSKFDKRIQSRMDRGFFTGSVDLTQATDHLPLVWMESIFDGLLRNSATDDQLESWELFLEVSRSNWYNDGIISRWKVGQPLGTLPSFCVLALTHNIWLESMCAAMGLGHSPYVILGDDLLIFNSLLRKSYIKSMSDRRIPMSPLKSHMGQLVQFAGKTYIPRQYPFYTTDHHKLQWSSLFDYQRATGVEIPYRNLPHHVKLLVARKVKDINQACKLDSVSQFFEKVYRIAQENYLVQRGSQVVTLRYPDESSRFWSLLDDSDQSETTVQVRTTAQLIDGGIHSVIRQDTIKYDDYRLKTLSKSWFLPKFRPVTTDKLILAATLAAMDQV